MVTAGAGRPATPPEPAGTVPSAAWADRWSADPAAGLAGGVDGPDLVRRLAAVALDAAATGARDRGGPVPAGGPDAVARAVRAACPDLLPEDGAGAEAALTAVVRALAAGAADPADPLCAAHLHAPPLAVAAAADLTASTLNPSMDSWDQAPAASELERLVTAAVAGLAYPDRPSADAVVTTGATESNMIALLLARERSAGPVRLLCSDEAHHSVPRAAWLLGLPSPVTVPTRDGRLHPDDLAAALDRTPGPHVVTATAGTTSRGVVDPVSAIADVAAAYGAHLHVDAAYGGGALFSDVRRELLAGLDRADTVALDLHKLGWQPLAAGLLAVADRSLLAPLSLHADYLNAGDDTEAGLPDLLGRSFRTSRRPDVVKIATTFLALGRAGLGALTDRCCAAAEDAAGQVDRRPGLRLLSRPELSTVLFRPVAADRLGDGAGDELVAGIRRSLLASGGAVLGRATVPGPSGGGRLWLKLTVLNPHITAADLTRLLDLVEQAADRLTRAPRGVADGAITTT
jgi:L-2,4-diaminobutyrate decarboxylase